MKHLLEKVSGATAAGAAAAGPNPGIYGNFLTTHGFLTLSWAEWFQVLGAVYVVMLIGKMVGLWPLLGRLIRGRKK